TECRSLPETAVDVPLLCSPPENAAEIYNNHLPPPPMPRRRFARNAAAAAERLAHLFVAAFAWSIVSATEIRCLHGIC
ncbi:hypothetical protein Tco_0740189, partial [Tanacetum coccineum]